MIRLGRYDAFDKWDILCRYWQDNDSVGDIGLDKFERPRLPNWHAVAATGGTRACYAYLHARASGAGPETADDINAPDPAEEIPHLVARHGLGGLEAHVRQLVATITGGGFAASFDDALPPPLVARLREVFRLGALRALQWTQEAGEIPSLELLRDDAPQSFPKEAVKRRKNVLSMFCAWFYGRSDVIHVLDACPEQVTLVDLHQPSLADMALIYPRHWNYVHADFQAFLRQAEAQRLSYDLILCDPFREPAEAVAWEALPTIMRLCSDTFITNYFVEMFEELGVAPDDLAGLSRAVKDRTGVDVEFTETVHRSSAVYWAVMRKR